MIENPTTFYITRHGQTDWNIQGLIHGHADIPLNETGKQQAHKLKERFSNVHFDQAFSSDLQRARQTAEIIALEKGLIIKTTEALREGNMGVFEGVETDPFFELLNAWRSQSEEEQAKHEKAQDYKSVETPESMVDRFTNFLKDTAEKYKGANILIVTHAGVIRHFLASIGFGAVKRAPNTSFVRIETNGENFLIKEAEGIEREE